MKHLAMAALVLTAGTAPAWCAVGADTVALHEVEVVNNRATAKTPIAFTNVTKGELERTNDGRDIPFLLSMTPSMIVTSDAGVGVGYTSMRVRGTDGTRINVTANGVPINGSEDHIVYWVDMPDLASSLRDVQVQRGAGTSTNGAGAFGASINMLTDAPSEDAYAELSASYGSYNTNKQTLRVGSGLLGDHWSADARVSHIGSDGYIDRATTQLWSYFGQVAYSSYNTNLRLLAFGGKERTYMAWDYASKEEMEKYGRTFNPCGAIYEVDEYGQQVSKKIMGYYPDQYDYFTQHHVQLLLAQRITDNLRLNAALHYTDDYGNYEQFKAKRTLAEYGLVPYYVDTPDGPLKIKKQDLVREKFNDNGFGGAILSFNFTKGRWDTSVGGDINYFHGNHFGNIKWIRNYVGYLAPQQEYYRNIGKKLDGNIYARANYDIGHGLSAYADLQYRLIHYTINGQGDNYDYGTESMQYIDVDRRWDFFNPKLGLNYTTGHHRVFASWSVAHREPARNCFTDGDAHHTPLAERLFDYEAGYTFSHKIFTVGANLYFMDYKDQLVLTGQISDTGAALTVNVPSSYRMGIELQGALKPCNWFDWEVNATFSRNRIKEYTEYINDDDWGYSPITVVHKNTPISYSPDIIVNNAFNFKYREFDATLRTHFVSRQYMMNNGEKTFDGVDLTIDPYCVTDLFVGYSFGKIGGLRDLRLGVSINNLFNKKYESNGYAGKGYRVNYDEDGNPELDAAGKPVKNVYGWSVFAAQAPLNTMVSLTLKF